MEQEVWKIPQVTVKIGTIEGGLTDVTILYNIFDEHEERIGEIVIRKPYDSLNDYQNLAEKITEHINREIEERYRRIKAMFPQYQVKMNLKQFADHYTANFELTHLPASSEEQNMEATEGEKENASIP